MTDRPNAPPETSRFWPAGEDLNNLTPPPPPEEPPVLERLGPSPFPRSRFPFLGLLATIYDHITTHTRTRGGQD